MKSRSGYSNKYDQACRDFREVWRKVNTRQKALKLSKLAQVFQLAQYKDFRELHPDLYVDLQQEFKTEVSNLYYVPYILNERTTEITEVSEATLCRMYMRTFEEQATDTCYESHGCDYSAAVLRNLVLAKQFNYVQRYENIIYECPIEVDVTAQMEEYLNWFIHEAYEHGYSILPSDIMRKLSQMLDEQDGGKSWESLGEPISPIILPKTAHAWRWLVV